MKKRISLFVMALLSLAALAVNGSDRADAGKGWEQAASIARNDLLAITSADVEVIEFLPSQRGGAFDPSSRNFLWRVIIYLNC